MADGGIDVKLVGGESLKDLFDHLATDARDKAIRKALRAGAEIEQAAIVEATPERIDTGSSTSTALPPGALKADVEITMGRTNDDNAPFAVIGFGKYTKHVARFVQDGHRIVRGGYSRPVKKNGAKTGLHRGPGKEVGQVQGHPFVSTAFEASRQEVADTMKTTLQAAIVAASKGKK